MGYQLINNSADLVKLCDGLSVKKVSRLVSVVYFQGNLDSGIIAFSLTRVKGAIKVRLG